MNFKPSSLTIKPRLGVRVTADSQYPRARLVTPYLWLEISGEATLDNSEVSQLSDVWAEWDCLSDFGLGGYVVRLKSKPTVTFPSRELSAVSFEFEAKQINSGGELAGAFASLTVDENSDLIFTKSTNFPANFSLSGYDLIASGEFLSSGWLTRSGDNIYADLDSYLDLISGEIGTDFPSNSCPELNGFSEKLFETASTQQFTSGRTRRIKNRLGDVLKIEFSVNVECGRFYEFLNWYTNGIQCGALPFSGDWIAARYGQRNCLLFGEHWSAQISGTRAIIKFTGVIYG